MPAAEDHSLRPPGERTGTVVTHAELLDARWKSTRNCKILASKAITIVSTVKVEHIVYGRHLINQIMKKP